MLYYIGFFVVQIQTINLSVWIPIFISLIGVSVSIYATKTAKIKMEQEQKEKLATKDYVLDKVSKVDTDVLHVSKDLKEHKQQNNREIDAIKEEFGGKLDLILEFVKSKTA